jgi:hypothetical protein
MQTTVRIPYAIEYTDNAQHICKTFQPIKWIYLDTGEMTADWSVNSCRLEGMRRRRVVIDAGENAFYNSGNNTPHMKSQCVGVYKRFHICNDQVGGCVRRILRPNRME